MKENSANNDSLESLRRKGNEVCSNDATAHRRRGGLPLGSCKRGSACRTIRSCMSGSPAVASDRSFKSLKPIFRRSVFLLGCCCEVGRYYPSVPTQGRRCALLQSASSEAVNLMEPSFVC